jgi:orotate phosphoribosyltransferase
MPDPVSLTNLQPNDLQALTTAPIDELRPYLRRLICQVAYREGDFLLTSGQRTDYYINGKQVTLHPQGAIAVGRILLSMMPEDAIAVAGLTLGADPMVTAVSVVAGYEGRSLAALIVRKEAKGHGTQAYIEGLSLPPQSPVVVLEDVVTTGQSALKAVGRLRSNGYQVDRILALVDRKQGGRELYEQHQLQFEAIFTVDDLRQEWAAQHAG